MSSTTALAQAPKSEIVTRYQRLKGALARAKETAQLSVRRGAGAAVTAGGGFMAGVIDDRMPEIGGLPTNVIAGITLAGAGIAGAAGDQSELLVNLGSGLLAGAAYGQGVKMSRELTQKLA